MIIKVGYVGSADWIQSTCDVKFEINELGKISIIR